MVAKRGTVWHNLGRLVISKDAQHRPANTSKDVKKLCRSAVQRSSFDHCGAPGYNIAVGHCCLRLRLDLSGCPRGIAESVSAEVQGAQYLVGQGRLLASGTSCIVRQNRLWTTYCRRDGQQGKEVRARAGVSRRSCILPFPQSTPFTPCGNQDPAAYTSIPR